MPVLTSFRRPALLASAPLLAAAFIAPLATPLGAQATCTPAARTTPSAALATVDSMVATFMRAEKIPGMSVGVVRCGATLLGRGYGTADVEHAARANGATLFRLASVSKPIAATLAARLAEQGKLDLDAPIQRYVPSFPEKGAPVTARQLMSHTGGIRHYRGDEITLARQFPSLDSAVAIFSRDSLVHAPGTGYQYTTYGYTLLGAAIERACGTTFTACLTRELLAPNGIREIVEDQQAAIIPNRARPYALDRDGTLRNAGLANTSYKVPGGGLIASGEAVARFADLAMRGSLVQPATWARMITPVTLPGGRALDYGEGWGRPRDSALLPGVVSHTGSQQGTSAVVYLVPESGVTVALLANLEDVGGRDLTVLADRIARVVGKK